MSRNKPRTLRFPTEIITQNKHKLQVRLRRVYRQLRRHSLTPGQCKIIGIETIKQNHRELTKQLRDYVTDRGLEFTEAQKLEDMLQETLEWWLGIINDMEIPVEEAAVHSSHKAACTCSEYIRLEAASSDYWRTTPGLTRRIDSLSQQFAYNTVNAVTTQVGMQNGGVWIQWVDKGDSKVCTICRGYATGGPKGNGFYPLTEAPIEQPHIGCRCERRVYFYDPFGD